MSKESIVDLQFEIYFGNSVDMEYEDACHRCSREQHTVNFQGGGVEVTLVLATHLLSVLTVTREG